MTIPLEESINRAADLISQADALVIAAGAGMGVDSGLPDFRGREGFWNAYPALGKHQIDFYNIASPEAFQNMPGLAWGFYGHRLNLYRNTQPHAGFEILKKWGDNMLDGYSIFTSNVDGQFQKAGFNPLQIHECHGSIHHLQCTEPCDKDIWRADDFFPVIDDEACQLMNDFPVCKHCGAMARPNILMFGDMNWLDNNERMQASRQERWLASITRPVVVEIGAGTAIPSVRQFSEWMLHRYGGKLIRINLNDYAVSASHGVGIAASAIPALLAIDEILVN